MPTATYPAGAVQHRMEIAERPATLFAFDVAQPVSNNLKLGIQKVFTTYGKSTKTTRNEARKHIVSALHAIASVQPPSKPAKRGTHLTKRPHGYKFFSAVEDTLVTFYKNGADEPFRRESDPLFHKDKSSKSANQARNDKFKDLVSAWIIDAIKNKQNEVFVATLSMVFSILADAEDAAGPFVEVFEAHVGLLKQLADVYEFARLEDLNLSKGAFGHGLAVEEGLKAVGHEADGETV